MSAIGLDLWRIMAALDAVTAGCYLNSDEETMLSDGSRAGTCTDSARLLQKVLGGEVVGYEHEHNQLATVGEAEGGHDFLIVGEWLVDWWARDTYGLPAVLHRVQDQAAILKAYGKSENWEVWCDADLKYSEWKDTILRS